MEFLSYVGKVPEGEIDSNIISCKIFSQSFNTFEGFYAYHPYTDICGVLRGVFIFSL